MTTTGTIDLQQAARDHLWLHFTRMGGYRDAEVPIIVRGDGCYLEDSGGKRYLDALAGLFSVNIGYGFGEEIGQAALEQMRELPFYTNWSYAHPRSVELAAEVAELAPGDLNRVFFVSGGSEAVESAWKLARQYYSARGQKRVRTVRATEPETMHDAIVTALGLDSARVSYLDDTGHMSGVDPLLGLDRAVRAAEIDDGDLVVLLAAGTGYTWAATALAWGAAE